jgi:hypothetical protein
MIVYQIIKDCVVSFRENDKSTEICLHEGDFIFLSENKIYIKEDFNYNLGYYKFKSFYLLTDIYYKRTIITGLDEFDKIQTDFIWTWEKNQNIINPVINRIESIIFEKDGEIEYAKEFLKDVSVEWNRDKKINDLINK